MDVNNNGKINKDELKIGLHKLGHQVPDTDIQILMEAVSNTLNLRSFNHIQAQRGTLMGSKLNVRKIYIYVYLI